MSGAQGSTKVKFTTTRTKSGGNLRVGKVYAVQNKQDILWNKKWWKFEVRKGIQSSQQLKHFVGQKVAEI